MYTRVPCSAVSMMLVHKITLLPIELYIYIYIYFIVSVMVSDAIVLVAFLW